MFEAEEWTRNESYSTAVVELATFKMIINSTQIAAIALLLLSMHPQLWVELLTFKPKCTTWSLARRTLKACPFSLWPKNDLTYCTILKLEMDNNIILSISTVFPSCMMRVLNSPGNWMCVVASCSLLVCVDGVVWWLSRVLGVSWMCGRVSSCRERRLCK